MTGFLQVPPFPGARRPPFDERCEDRGSCSDTQVDELIERVRTSRVGGTYWAAQPQMPAEPFTLIRVADRRRRASAAASADGPTIVWSEDGNISGDCDPWHVLGNARQLIVDSGDPLALIAAIAGVPVLCVGDGPYSALSTGRREDLRRCFRREVLQRAYRDPFNGPIISCEQAIELCAFWRRLVDSNRDIGLAVGFGAWKQEAVAPLLWNGSKGVRFVSGEAARIDGNIVAVWKARTPERVLEKLETGGATLLEVEDGFIRSAGLGADCVPPQSIVVDRAGIYFDPGSASDLEIILQNGPFPPPQIERARALRERIVELGISKYESGREPLDRRNDGKRHVLVPGQVEDDRSIRCGGGDVATNLELLRRVRDNVPDAFITYKPHPDVEAGHRVGALPDRTALELADEVVRDQPISALLEIVDEVHVNTSLAGFEALVRSKPVTTYGVPFFAGWGLTTDLGPVPARRTAKRSLDELVAAALLMYPRYVDPVTGLPCPPEVLLERLSDGTSSEMTGMLVRLRRLQGKLKRAASRLRPFA